MESIAYVHVNNRNGSACMLLPREDTARWGAPPPSMLTCAHPVPYQCALEQIMEDQQGRGTYQRKGASGVVPKDVFGCMRKEVARLFLPLVHVAVAFSFSVVPNRDDVYWQNKKKKKKGGGRSRGY